jgi:hypothetical protein
MPVFEATDRRYAVSRKSFFLEVAADLVQYVSFAMRVEVPNAEAMRGTVTLDELGIEETDYEDILDGLSVIPDAVIPFGFTLTPEMTVNELVHELHPDPFDDDIEEAGVDDED